MFTLLEFDDVDSTSSILKEHYSSFPHFTVIRTNYQKFGRGQFDRVWDAEAGKNVLMSLLLKDIHINTINNIKNQTVAVLMHVLKTYGIKATFKAPNDLYVGHEKICGILIETKANHNQLDYAVIGIGLNVNQKKFGNYKATSMSNILNKVLDLKVVFYDIFIGLEKTFKED